MTISRADMNEKAIEAAAKAIESVHGDYKPTAEDYRTMARAALAAALPPLRAREEIAEINERIESWHNDERTLYPDCEVLEFCDLVDRALSRAAGQEWRDINLAREAFQRIIDFPYVGVEASHAIISIARGGLTSLSAPPVAEPIVAEKSEVKS